jgi:hypothetical protein
VSFESVAGAVLIAESAAMSVNGQPSLALDCPFGAADVGVVIHASPVLTRTCLAGPCPAWPDRNSSHRTLPCQTRPRPTRPYLALPCAAWHLRSLAGNTKPRLPGSSRLAEGHGRWTRKTGACARQRKRPVALSTPSIAQTVIRPYPVVAPSRASVLVLPCVLARCPTRPALDRPPA